MRMTNFILGIAGALITGVLLGVGKMLWSLTGEVRAMSTALDALTKKVEKLERLVEQGRKWRFDRTPLPQVEDEG